ncbi:hypothetical protein Tco_0919904 [Tanacetum coccineum]
MEDMVEANQALEERLDKQGSRLYKLKNLDIPYQVSKAVDEIVMDAVDWAIQAPLRDRFKNFPEADMKEILHHRMWESNSYKAHEDHKKLKKKKKRHDLPKTPPGSPPHQPPLPPPPAGPSGTSRTSGASGSSQLPPPHPPPSTNQNLHMDNDTAPDEQVHSSGDEDIGHDRIPTTGDMAIFIDWFCKKQGTTELKQQDLEGPAYEIVKVFHPNMIHLQYQMEECHKLLTDQVDESLIRAVRTHMRILGVVRIEVFSLYGYDYMKKIVLYRADLKEYTIAERDFKYLYPSDFEDLYLLNLQGHLNHLSPEDKKILAIDVNLWTRNLVIRQRVEDFQLGIESYQTQLNLTKPRWDATGFEFKHEFIVIDSLRAVTVRDKYGVQMIMRFNEIHKFSDGTLQQINEALDY